MRILVIEDEPKVARALEEGLTHEHYDVCVATTGEEGFYKINAQRFDLVLLDLMLPGRDGIEILRTVRQRGLDTPFLILTARDAVDDRVLGLDAGADDYLVKPFAFSELLARVRALLRRGRPQDALRLKVGDLEMDVATRRVTRGGVEIELTPREFQILECMLRRQGSPVSRDTLCQEAWGGTGRATPLDNVIDVHMARLRRKLDDGQENKLLHTIRGVGFVVREDEP
ncbi:MAG: response regulator transcription factor [Deltaproteobacteria bacterium]|jgi:two-component system copper resistance phosphate regulon response regulator CusR